MIFATAFGGELLTIVDAFINHFAILLGVIVECIIFAWVFKAERLIDFMNSRSKTIKLGKWWLVIVKYILPIFVSIVWIGGVIDLMEQGSSTQLIITIISAVILLVSTLVFTLLPAKNQEWSEGEERL
jgi:NSS family neurotransmitter:Na+ symporter